MSYDRMNQNKTNKSDERPNKRMKSKQNLNISSSENRISIETKNTFRLTIIIEGFVLKDMRNTMGGGGKLNNNFNFHS